MIDFQTHITNKQWRSIFSDMQSKMVSHDGYNECIGFNYSFDPQTDHVISSASSLLQPKKLHALIEWYISCDNADTSICEYFEEYRRCIDDAHTTFNSNYGCYAFGQYGLRHCIYALCNDQGTRHACFCINNNDVSLDKNAIDYLCTNAISFFIQEHKLHMVVQMRSSNMLTLLPYDVVTFTMFYSIVFSAVNNVVKTLEIGRVYMQIGSCHYYDSDATSITESNIELPRNLFGDMREQNCTNHFLKLLQMLKNL